MVSAGVFFLRVSITKVTESIDIFQEVWYNIVNRL